MKHVAFLKLFVRLHDIDLRSHAFGGEIISIYACWSANLCHYFKQVFLNVFAAAEPSAYVCVADGNLQYAMIRVSILLQPHRTVVANYDPGNFGLSAEPLAVTRGTPVEKPCVKQMLKKHLVQKRKNIH